MVENLTVVIPFYQGHDTIRRLIDSLPAEQPIIIVDDQSIPALQRQEWMDGNVKIVRPALKGYFAGAVNYGIDACRTDVLVLNQDTWFTSDYWEEMVDELRSRYAMIGERIRGTHPSFGSFGYIHGTFMFLRRDAISQVGELNRQDYPLWGCTAEYQWRAVRKGFEVYPLSFIPGFKHERPETESFGSSIQELLKREPTRREQLIRTPPLLSVIVPCYNYGRYVKECIASLIGGTTSLGRMPGQTLQSFEIIIVDDASTDDSWSLIEKVTDIRKGIRSYRLDRNHGTAGALNYGIREAHGQYITFLSADDMREPNSLEVLVRHCQNHPHTFAYDDVCLVAGGKRIKQWDMQDYNFEELIWRNQVHAGIVFPKQAWEEVGGYPEVMGNGREDWAFNVALGVHGWCGEHVRQYGYLYRRENQNRSLTNTSPEHHERFLSKIKHLFPAIYRGERPMACCGRGRTLPKNSPSSLSMQSVANKTISSSSGGLAMKANVDSTEMVKIQYDGKAMTAVWDGPFTNTRYRFGSDRRAGWIYKADLGERGKGGFLNFKDRQGNYLFSLGATTEEKAPTPAKTNSVTATVVDVAPTEIVETVVIEQTEVPTEEQVTVTTSSKPVAKLTSTVEHPNPTELNTTEIKALVLTQEQWRAVYEDEMAADRPRKSVITFIEEKLASE